MVPGSVHCGCQGCIDGKKVTEIRLHNVDESVCDMLKEQAGRKGMSLNAYLNALLEEQATKPQREFAAQARIRLLELKQKYGTFTDSVHLIREDRDMRG